MHFSAYLYISLHISTFLCTSLHISAFLYTSLHFTAFLWISLHISTFFCIYLDFPANLYIFCISLHISTFFCISLNFSALTFHILGQLDGVYRRPMDANYSSSFFLHLDFKTAIKKSRKTDHKGGEGRGGQPF